MHMHTSSAASGSGSGNNAGHISGIDEGSRAPQGLLDSLSDTLLNAFSKVRKPDERFESMKDRLERLDEGLAGVERVVNRGRVRWTGKCARARARVLLLFPQAAVVFSPHQRSLPR